MIELPVPQYNMVQTILQQQIPDCEVRAFGSRVNGTASTYSDLDLVIIGYEKMDWRKLEKLRDAFAQSDLSIIIDIHDWYSIPESFKHVINRNYVTLQKASGS